MAGKEFGEQVRLHREARGWSRTDLEERSGVSESTIENYEGPAPPAHPKRKTVVAIAVAFGWDVDKTLALAGLPRLTSAQREVLLRPVVDRKTEVDRVWPRLSVRQQAAVADLVVAMVEPHGPGLVVPEPRVIEGPDPLVSHRSRVVDGPVDPNHGNGEATRAVEGCGSVPG